MRVLDLEQLHKVAKELNIREEELDNLVIDCKSLEATDINNDGLMSQLEYLLFFLGQEGSETALKDIRDETLRINKQAK